MVDKSEELIEKAKANKLTCYCTRDDKDSRHPYKMTEKGYDDWRDRYKKSLKECFDKSDSEDKPKDETEDKPKKPEKVYADPDERAKDNKPDYFLELENFMNKQEKKFKENLEGSFRYKYLEPAYIRVFDNQGRHVCDLGTDQFGFSRPSSEKKHPYDLYITLSENKDDAINKVIDWISCTRTIGGSFLWPSPLLNNPSNYNLYRGGTIKCGSYMQDRVDLALWEIKQWYIGNESTTLWDCISKLDKDKHERVEKWFNHFESFETYVEFFKFNDKFGDFVNKDYKVISLFDANKPISEIPEKREITEDIFTKEKKLKELEELLNHLSEKVVNRSIAIIDS